MRKTITAISFFCVLAYTGALGVADLLNLAFAPQAQAQQIAALIDQAQTTTAAGGQPESLGQFADRLNRMLP
jgi:hypothetical protein